MRWVLIPQDERDYIRRLARWRQERGKPPPKHAAMQPVDLDDKHTDLWDAFLELKQSAAVGWSVEPVTPSDVLAWCRLHCVPRWRWRTFWRVVHCLDREARRLMDAKGKPDGQDPSRH